MNIIESIEQLNQIPQTEKHLWYIPENISAHIQIEESNEPLLNIDTEAKNMGVNLILASVSPAPYNKSMFLRKGAIDCLFQAAKKLEEKSNGEIIFKLTDTFRPLELQKKYFEEIKQDIMNKEGLSGKELWERVTQFIADPDLCPPHSTGGAIDLTLAYGDSQEELNMGTPVDTIDDKANTWHESVVGEERKNRNLLFEVMTNAGFVNLTSEWWHYSYGDGYWGAFNGKNALYGSQEKMPE